MTIRISKSKNGTTIRATGKDANALFKAMSQPVKKPVVLAPESGCEASPNTAGQPNEQNGVGQ